MWAKRRLELCSQYGQLCNIDHNVVNVVNVTWTTLLHHQIVNVVNVTWAALTFPT